MARTSASSMSARTLSWIEGASRPKHEGKRYKGESFGAGGFGCGGARFERESLYNRTPGPGAYGSPDLPRPQTGCIISEANPLGELDWAIIRAKQVPGPGHNVPLRQEKVPGGRVCMGRPKSVLDRQILAAMDTPGPGSYSQPVPRISGGIKFREGEPLGGLDRLMKRSASTPGPSQYQTEQNYLTKSGGRFNLTVTPSVVELAVQSKRDIPGPGAYSVDADTRVQPTAGGAFNLYTPASDLDKVILRAKESPGPGQYESMSVRAGYKGQVDMRVVSLTLDTFS